MEGLEEQIPAPTPSSPEEVGHVRPEPLPAAPPAPRAVCLCGPGLTAARVWLPGTPLGTVPLSRPPEEEAVTAPPALPETPREVTMVMRGVCLAARPSLPAKMWKNKGRGVGGGAGRSSPVER